MDQFDLADHGGGSLAAAFAKCGVRRALVLGVESDMLSPSNSSAKLPTPAAAGRATVESTVPVLQGHDAFLVDLARFEPALGNFLRA